MNIKSEEHVFALLGLIIFLLAALLLYFIYKEIKGGRHNGRCISPIVRNAAFMGEAPNACSSGLETRNEERNPWDRTLSVIEDLVAHQYRQLKKPLVIRNDPKIDIFNGKGMVKNWIRKVERVLAQMTEYEDDKVRFVLNHIEGVAAERLFNCGREWTSVNDVYDELMKVYGQSVSVWELYERLAARKQQSEETVWEFLDTLLEISDEFQNQRGVDKKLIGECMARNMSEPSLGVKMKRRMEERPDDSLEQWVEWVAMKEREWKCFTRRDANISISTSAEGRTRERDREKSMRERNNICFSCGETGHISRWCSKTRLPGRHKDDRKRRCDEQNAGNWEGPVGQRSATRRSPTNW